MQHRFYTITRRRGWRLSDSCLYTRRHVVECRRSLSNTAQARAAAVPSHLYGHGTCPITAVFKDPQSLVTHSVLQRRSLEQCAPCDRPNLLDCRLAIVLEKYSRAQETSAVKQSPSRHRFHSFLMCGNTRTQNSSNGTVSIAAYPSLNSITYQQAILRRRLCGHPFDEICLCVVGPSPWTLVNVEECFRRGPT